MILESTKYRRIWPNSKRNGDQVMTVGKKKTKNLRTIWQRVRRAAAVVFVFVLTIVAMSSLEARGAQPAKKAAAKNAAPDPNKGYRKKELNFEERVIEGLSNKGYESLSQTGTADALRGEKLYRKRAEFDEDSKSLLREMEYLK